MPEILQNKSGANNTTSINAYEKPKLEVAALPSLERTPLEGDIRIISPKANTYILKFPENSKIDFVSHQTPEDKSIIKTSDCTINTDYKIDHNSHNGTFTFKSHKRETFQISATPLPKTFELSLDINSLNKDGQTLDKLSAIITSPDGTKKEIDLLAKLKESK